MKRRIILKIEIDESKLLNYYSDDTIDEIIEQISAVNGIEVKEIFEGIEK